MFVLEGGTETIELVPGVLLRRLGRGESINAVHWNFRPGADLPLHQHAQEQFGFIIKGGFEVTIGGERRTLRAGDAYYVPANVPHRFVAIEDTEAIDVFTPYREVSATGGGVPETSRSAEERTR